MRPAKEPARIYIMNKSLNFISTKNFHNFFNKAHVWAIALGFILSLSLPIFVQGSASALSGAPSAKVSFTFDDSLASSYTQAAPTLAKYGFSGTEYVVTSCVGMTSAPNNCRANQDKTYLTWDQIVQLKNSGWEIGSHGVSHALLASSDPDDQPEVLTPTQLSTELNQSKADLAAHGINATAFATPYGDWTPPVLAEITKVYSSHRGFADVGYNTFPYSDALVYVQQVQAGVSVETVKGYIDTAKANNQWLILVFHDIQPSATDDDYDYLNSDLDEIAQYVKSQNIPVTNITNTLSGGTNLLPNSTFDSGIAGGWTTDSPANIIANTQNNGSYPSPQNSVELNGAGTNNVQLFSPAVSVDSAQMYFIKSYLRVAQLTGGEVGYFIDEYDAAGSWLSGQYKVSEKTVFTEYINFEYKPSSAAVKSARLQIIVTGGSGIKAYVDNVQWFAEGSAIILKPGDINGDDAINALDLSILLSHWNASGASRSLGDLSGDGIVNALDLSILLTNWGK